MPARLKLLITRRSLVPGETMTVPAPSHLEAEERLVVVHRRHDGSPSDIGTVARVDGPTTSSAHPGYLTVTGLELVLVGVVGDVAEVEPVPEPRLAEAAGLIGSVERRLRRYLAACAETGEGGDVHVSLSPDPVVAANEVASCLRVSWPEVQDLLEAGDAVDRLNRGALILDRETALLRSVMGRSDS